LSLGGGNCSQSAFLAAVIVPILVGALISALVIYFVCKKKPHVEQQKKPVYDAVASSTSPHQNTIDGKDSVTRA